jgi:hypothetical protein
MVTGKQATAAAGGTILATVVALGTFTEQLNGLFDGFGGGAVEARVELVAQQHVQDMEALRPMVQASVDYGRKAYGNTLPPRILNILQHKCKDPEAYDADPTLENLLNDLLNDYKDLNGREYRVGTCNNSGEYCGAMDAPCRAR